MGLDSNKARERELTLREREMHRYYQSWLHAHGSANNLNRHVNDLAQVDDFSLESLHDIGYQAKQSRDRALTAFAQLASLRLGVRRAMVSLMDSTNQYILAEATRTLSLVDSDRHAKEDALWLGSTILDKSDAVCECVLRRQYTVKDFDGKGNNYTLRGAVIPDLALDPDYKDMPYVTAEPGVRFYAGVPIKSRSGHMIGVYSVSDEKPRAQLSYDEVRFMQDISVSIMDHLEWARDRVDRYKGERIVRGMAAFIEESPSMKAFEEERENDQLANTEEGQQTSATASSATSSDKEARTRTPAQSPRLSAQKSHITNMQQEDRPRKSSPSGQDKTNTTQTKREKKDSLTKLLDRAARILRDSTLAEGVVFFGPNGNGTNAKSSLRTVMSARARFSDRDGTGTGTDEEKRSSSNEIADGDPSTDSDANSQMRTSKILGISLANKRDATVFQNTALAVPTLENYFRLYPHGKSFHFSEAGSGLSSEDESASASEGHKDKRTGDDYDRGGATEKVLDRKKKIKMSHTELLKNLPGVRNVIFVPFWDYVEGSMVAGCFLWTSTTGRMMNLDDDLSYLRAFGNTIMSEVSRIKAMKDDRAKTTFIASMSHELRSPLHGILGSVEFLQDTAADSYQTGLINSIATCGKTLLDTLDHVLDYAKINKLGRARMRRNVRSNRLAKSGRMDASMESLNITAEIDLGLVVEEVVEAVCAGHAFKKMHTGQLESRSDSIISLTKTSPGGSCSGSPADGSNLREGEVSVLLDISPRVSWKVRTQPGALRRIIMNLLGNALKYTSSGFVAVSLRAQESANSNRIDAIFRVVDSGKGMSEDFQKNRLFVPFSQEDTFQPGTGLGLSIVRQIVDSLGGSIDVKSVQDVGTEMNVRLSIPAAETSISVVEEEMASVAAKTRGLRLCLLDPNHEKERPDRDHIARLDTTLREVCYGWFEMDIIKASNMHGIDADVFMYTEPPSVEYLLEQHGVKKDEGTPDTGKNAPLIIVCLNTSEAIAVTANHSKKLSELGRVVEVIPQPCGPRKMARVLSHCIRRMEETFGQPIQEIDSTSSVALGKEVIPVTLTPPKPTLPPRSASEALREADRTRQYFTAVTNGIPPSSAIAFPDKKADHTSEAVGRFTDVRNDEITVQKDKALLSPSDFSKGTDVPHVLLVDDNRINLQLLVMFMKKHKFTYAEAQNGQEALDAYIASCTSSKRFDFVLMDISMPVMNGMEATRRIREHEQENGLSRATVIALTGLASASAQQEAESSGIDIYMPKPVKFQELRPLLVRNDSAVA